MSSRKTKYLQILSYGMITAIFVFFMTIAENCGRLPATSEDGFSKGDTLDIALIYGPGTFYINGDSLSGINLHIAEEFSKKTGLPIKTWPVADRVDALKKLEAGNYDVVASLPLDNNLKNKFPVSESVFLDRLVLIQLVDSTSDIEPITSSLHLNGKTVYVVEGSSGAQRMENLAEEIGGKIEVVELPELSDELLALKVANGSVPLAVVNEKVAKAVAEKYPNLKYDSSLSFSQFQVWVFNSAETEQLSKFNEWLDKFRTTEDYQTIILNH